jgi:hypothetical protein
VQYNAEGMFSHREKSNKSAGHLREIARKIARNNNRLREVLSLQGQVRIAM